MGDPGCPPPGASHATTAFAYGPGYIHVINSWKRSWGVDGKFKGADCAFQMVYLPTSLSNPKVPAVRGSKLTTTTTKKRGGGKGKKVKCVKGKKAKKAIKKICRKNKCKRNKKGKKWKGKKGKKGKKKCKKKAKSTQKKC